MRITSAVRLKELVQVTRRGHRPVGELENLRLCIAHQPDQSHAPASFSWRRVPSNDVPPCRDKDTTQSMFIQNSNRLIQSVALADATEVKARPRLGKFDGAIFSVQFESTKADCFRALSSAYCGGSRLTRRA